MFGAIVVACVVAVAIVCGTAVTRRDRDALAHLFLHKVEQIEQNGIDKLLTINYGKAVRSGAVAEEKRLSSFPLLLPHRIEQMATAAEKLFGDAWDAAIFACLPRIGSALNWLGSSGHKETIRLLAVDVFSLAFFRAAYQKKEDQAILDAMNWHDYDLICFDFDGVLVDSESLHFAAYKQMCAKRGFSLKWDDAQYAKYALYSADGLRQAILNEFPKLKEFPWETLYTEKKAALQTLIETHVALMPGASEFLESLKGLPTCVVTNSLRSQVETIKKRHPILQTIPRWITREDYSNPKPDPECYKLAIQGAKKAIGFEDSPRGLSALLGSGAEAILITDVLPQEEVAKLPGSFRHVESFHTLLP